MYTQIHSNQIKRILVKVYKPIQSYIDVRPVKTTNIDITIYNYVLCVFLNIKSACYVPIKLHIIDYIKRSRPIVTYECLSITNGQT